MENGGERRRGFASDLVLCSTCSGFVMRKKPTAIPDPDEEVVEVVTKAKKMRDLMQAVLLHGPFQEKEPAKATMKQWQVLRRRRMIMMETKRCPACSRSLLEMCRTCSRSLSEKPGPDEEDKAAGSKEKKKSSREEGSELMDVLPSQGGKERKKIAMEDEANARSVKKTKRSREEGKRSSNELKKEKKGKSEDKEGKGSSSGLKKKKKKAKSDDKEGSGSKIKAMRSSEMEGRGSKEAGMEGRGSKEAKMEVSESAGGNGKTKMVTRRLDKVSIDFILKEQPPVKPFLFDTCNPFLHRMFASDIARYEVHCEFHEYLHRQSIIKGYAEYQLEVTDDEDE